MSHHLFSRTTRFLCVALLCLLAAGATFAQTGTSNVRGTVVDAQGNAVAGATVTLLNAEKNFNRTQTTNEQGGYTFTAVPPDTYRVEAEASNFKKVVVSDVRALVDTPTDIDVQLEVGAVTETVDVSAATDAPLNTTDATIGNTFEAQRIEELPLNARNVVGLLSLQPGVTRDGYVNGARSDQTNVTLDGVDNNEQQTGLDVQASIQSGTDEAFATVLRSTPDSLQEFRVTTTNPNADQGRSSGAQVSLVTRSGGNDFRGALYYYHRNTATTSNDFFNNRAGVERPQLLRNLFGGRLGGPVIRDRAFFFFNYEGFRQASGFSVVREVPLPTLGQGIVRYASDSGAGDPCPTSAEPNRRCLALNTSQINAAYIAANGVTPGVNPTALAILAAAARRYPVNDNTVGDGANTGGFRFNARTPSRFNTYIGRFDLNLTDRQTLLVRGNYQHDTITRVSQFPDTAAPTLSRQPRGIAVGHTWSITNNLVNRFSYGLTRDSFTSGGDSVENSASFRFIFSPLGFSRTLVRTTPVNNFVDDLSLIAGNHSLSFGGNVRLIRNNRVSTGGSFDSAVTNPSFYDFSGAAVIFNTETFDPIFSDVSADFETDLRDALTATIGRFSQYSASINYDADGNLLPVGTPIPRSFATEEYEAYVQDSWRIRPNLTFTYGLRYSTSTPVYERNGVQVSPTQSLGDFFERRARSADMGVPLNELITLDRAGKVNNRPGYYDQDFNNFAPSIAVAYSPNLGGFFGSALGRNGKSVIRGGYRLSYDRIGSQLAVNFDLNSSLGFASEQTVAANTFNVSDRLAPLFTGNNPNIRSLPGIAGTIAPSLTFPLTLPADEAQRIEQSLDDTITTPYNHSLNLSYEREIGKGLSFQVSYVGRFSRDLLASRDVMHLNNLRDPRSGQTWYEAINMLTDLRYSNASIASVGAIPFFENVLPRLARTRTILGTPTALTATQEAYRRVARPGGASVGGVGGSGITDYTFLQLLWDDGLSPLGDNLFFHPQYAALSTFSTIARSNYNSGQVSVRQRFGNDLSFDFNYTLSHSLDNASGLQNSTGFGSAFIINPLDPDLSYATSDFDTRHVFNVNVVSQLPFGRNKSFLNNLPRVANALVSDFQLTSIFRYNTGLPVTAPLASDRWATNWNVQSNMVRVNPINSQPSNNPTPNLFSDPGAAFRSFRDPRAGETGDRNIFREPNYVSLDLGLYRTFRITERQSLQFRAEGFNITNTQRFAGSSVVGFGLSQDPFLPNVAGGMAQPQQPSSDFGNFTSTQKSLNEPQSAGRVFQFALRYEF